MEHEQGQARLRHGRLLIGETMKTTGNWKIIKYKGTERIEVDDVVATEARLRVSVNGHEVLSLYCTPFMIRELVVGLLMTEGVAEGICTDRMSIQYGQDIEVDVPAEGEIRRQGATVTSGCVGGITFHKELTTEAMKDNSRFHREAISGLFAKFHSRSELYASTGCIHSAALVTEDGIVLFAEDIGRHNAVDKVIGAAILEGVEFGGKMLLASGRLSSEIVSKCARWGIPLVVSRTAPTALALKMAESSGVTLVGFVRGSRMNVYTHHERVVA